MTGTRECGGVNGKLTIIFADSQSNRLNRSTWFLLRSKVHLITRVTDHPQHLNPLVRRMWLLLHTPRALRPPFPNPTPLRPSPTPL